MSTSAAPARGCEVCPLPLREPVSAAFAVTLKFHHASAAQRTNQINDGRNDAGATFTGKCLELWHSLLLSRERSISEFEPLLAKPTLHS